jgi:hypothetical protein
MRRHLLVTLAAVLAIAVSAGAARAQCSFEHPKKANKIQMTLVQAFVSCGNPGGNAPNADAGGVPSCAPPETYTVQAGNDTADGWSWDEDAAQGTLQFKPKAVCTGVSKDKLEIPPIPPCDPTDKFQRHCKGGANNGANCLVASECPGATGCTVDTSDLEVKLSLKGVLQDSPTPVEAQGGGTLATLARATLNDPTDGDMTVIDFPAGFAFGMVDGKANMKTSADAVLNSLSIASLPQCSSVEIVGIRVLDANGDTFAAPGTFLPIIVP